MTTYRGFTAETESTTTCRYRSDRGGKVTAAIFGAGTQRKGNVVAVRVLGVKKKSAPPPSIVDMFTRLLR